MFHLCVFLFGIYLFIHVIFYFLNVRNGTKNLDHAKHLLSH